MLEEDTHCDDCGVVVVPASGSDRSDVEWYMVRPSVWKAAAMEKGVLCIGCLEGRLGRELTADDFSDVPLNHRIVEGTFSASARLFSRLTRGEVRKTALYGDEMSPQIWVDHDGNGPPTEDKLPPVQNGERGHKPRFDTGMWTSTHGDPEGWIGWMRAEDWYLGEEPLEEQAVYRLRVRSHGVRVKRVDSLRDLVELVEDYGYDDELDLGRAMIDFEGLARTFDGLHLTARGQWATRLSEPNLYGWDCESTIWFRWAFESVERVSLREAEMPLFSEWTVGRAEARRQPDRSSRRVWARENGEWKRSWRRTRRK